MSEEYKSLIELCQNMLNKLSDYPNVDGYEWVMTQDYYDVLKDGANVQLENPSKLFDLNVNVIDGEKLIYLGKGLVDRMLIADRYNYLVAHNGDKNLDFREVFDTALQEFYDKVTDAFDELKAE